MCQLHKETDMRELTRSELVSLSAAGPGDCYLYTMGVAMSSSVGLWGWAARFAMAAEVACDY